MEHLNHLLCELPDVVRRGLSLAAARVPLRTREILQNQGEAEAFCYFPESGLVSLTRMLADGARVEAGLVGREGFVGSLFGEGPAFTEAKVECAGEAYRIETQALQAIAAEEPSVVDVLSRFQRFQLEEAQLNAVCNVSHGIEQRLSKWLLRCVDRVDGPKLALTQEAIAQMLGVQRTTVTACLQKLAARGVIRRARGQVEVIDRARLQARACECYDHAAERLPELGFPEVSDESACAA